MKTKALMVIVLLLFCSAILASGNDSEAEEYWRKTQELNRRAEQFKAETGFVGDIGYSYQAMGFTNYRGNFRDIPVTVPQDTVAMGQVFEQVLKKVKPYIRAREGQLVREAIVSYINRTFVTYRQRVNGYGIDGAGVLNIGYNIPTNEIVVIDNTVDIGSEIVQVNITEDQAIDAVLQYYDTNEDFDRDHWMFRRHIRLAYAPIEYDHGIVDYKLCYLISHGGGQNYVDPSTGEVIYTRIVRIANDDCYVTGDSSNSQDDAVEVDR